MLADTKHLRQYTIKALSGLLAHEELVIEQKRLPKPQEIDEQNSDSVAIKIPLRSQDIKL